MDNKGLFILGIGQVQSADNVVISTQPQITINGKLHDFPLTILETSRSRMHNFVDEFFDKLDKDKNLPRDFELSED